MVWFLVEPLFFPLTNPQTETSSFLVLGVREDEECRILKKKSRSSSLPSLVSKFFLFRKKKWFLKTDFFICLFFFYTLCASADMCTLPGSPIFIFIFCLLNGGNKKSEREELCVCVCVRAYVCGKRKTKKFGPQQKNYYFCFFFFGAEARERERGNPNFF